MSEILKYFFCKREMILMQDGRQRCPDCDVIVMIEELEDPDIKIPSKKTILADVDGWTPIIDHIVETHGLITAAVFGRVWSCCQLPTGRYSAGQERIVRELGVSLRTIRDHLKTLVYAEYLSAIEQPGLLTVYSDLDLSEVGMGENGAALSDYSL